MGEIEVDDQSAFGGKVVVDPSFQETPDFGALRTTVGAEKEGREKQVALQAKE